MPTFAVKTTTRQEQAVAGMIVTKEFEQIHTVLAPDSLTNCVTVKAGDDGIVTRVLEKVPHARGLVEGDGAIGTSSMTGVEHFLSPAPDVKGIAEGDIVELIAGPFKGEKVRVQRIDETKDQVTIGLYEATVPIPVTVHSNQIHVLNSEER